MIIADSGNLSRYVLIYSSIFVDETDCLVNDVWWKNYWEVETYLITFQKRAFILHMFIKISLLYCLQYQEFSGVA
jgi:hypothetical protein